MKYLKTSAIANEIDNIISDAKEGIVIVSPYLQLGVNIAEKLKAASDKKIPVEVIYRQEKDNYYTKKYKNISLRNLFTNVENTEIHQYDNLHAKLYFNEEVAVISSLNLYAYSEVNNFESGILITKSEEPEVFRDMLKDYYFLLRASKHEKGADLKLFNEDTGNSATPESSKSSKKIVNDHRGFCIRCGKPIEYSLKKPYCEEDSKRWEDETFGIFSDQDPVETNGFCHSCGKRCNPKKSQPLCDSCKKLSKTKEKKQADSEDNGWNLRLF